VTKSSENPKRLPFILLPLVAALLLFIGYRFLAGEGNGWKQIISSDGVGYYAYLPSLIIHADPSWENFTRADAARNPGTAYNPQFLTEVNGRPVNKYFAGEAILLLPFFLPALLLSWITQSPVDGLSFWFQLLAGTAALFYLVCGLYYVRKILASLGFGNMPSAVATMSVFLGTNLLWYSLGGPTMSHVFSFFAISSFLWHCMEFDRQGSDRTAVCCGILLALVILLRPVNLIILLAVPLLLKNKGPADFFSSLAGSRKPGFFGAFILLLLIQPVLWYLQTGHWIISSYPGEGFNLDSPRIADFLFSARRGWFVYTPLMAVALLGLFFLPGKRFIKPATLIAFLFAVVYISSSWWCWYYSDGYGQRPMVDFYPVFAIGMAALLDRSKQVPRLALLTLILFLTVLNLFQTWQFSSGIISSDNMTSAKYRHVFLRSADSFRNTLGGCREEPFYRADLENPLFESVNRFDSLIPGWINDYPEKSSKGNVFHFRQAVEFGPGVSIRFDSLSAGPSNLYCQVSFRIMDIETGASNKAKLVVKADSLRSWYSYYNAVPLNDLPFFGKGYWREMIFTFNMPVIANPGCHIMIYLWNPGRTTFLVDDMKIKLFGKIPD
jgi:hypothetical protein